MILCTCVDPIRQERKNPIERQEFEAKLIAKAQADESFRQALLTSPKTAIEKAFGAALGEGVEIKMVEESADTLYLVLPAAESELSDEALAQISGGWIEPDINPWVDPDPQPVTSKPSRR